MPCQQQRNYNAYQAKRDVIQRLFRLLFLYKNVCFHYAKAVFRERRNEMPINTSEALKMAIVTYNAMRYHFFSTALRLMPSKSSPAIFEELNVHDSGKSGYDTVRFAHES